MGESSWPQPTLQDTPPRRPRVPGWAKASGIGVAAFVLGASTGGDDTEPLRATSVQVTETETETERERFTEVETVTEAGPTVTEAAPTVTVTEVAPAAAAAPAPVPEPEPAPQPAPPAPVAPPPPASAYYDNCDAARTAGAAPLYQGEPGYRAGLDRDNDGIACE